LDTETASANLRLRNDERWFVARVLPGREASAHFNLQRQEFRSFAPKVRRTVRHARKFQTVLAPLFPGYIFVILDLSAHRWRCVNSTIGVSSLIMGGDRPMPVPRGVVESLIDASEASGLMRLDRTLEVGQTVRILSGPFASRLCRLVHLDDRGRIRVLLEFMGSDIAARLDRSAVAPAA
jgi:transcription antitermination factor NusG